MKISECRVGDVVLTDFDTRYAIEAVYPEQGQILVAHIGTNHRYLIVPEAFKSKKELVSEYKKTIEDEILCDVEKMLKRGTSFACFDHNDKHRHVLIGTEEAGEYNMWGEHLNRAILEHNGKKYLLAVDLLDDGQIKHFDISKISNWMAK